MSKHYDSYIERISKTLPLQAIESIGKTVRNVSSKYVSKFDSLNHETILLLGNVQSGKTGHMLGILADAADQAFEVFIILTTDNVDLQMQTYERALDLEATFCVCGEQDDIRFRRNNVEKRPVILVLKKNYSVLKKWKERLESSEFIKGRSVFIIDDEADAASLNTKVNKENEVSTINQRITEIRESFNSSFYLQVTATPQSLFLQSARTKYKPKSVYYFEPGDGYLGGNFFYKTDAVTENEIPPVINFTEEDELSDLLDDTATTPEGLQDAISSFLITAAHIHLTKSRSSCNFLIHPSVSISAHEGTAKKIGEALNNLLDSMRYDKSSLNNIKLKGAWDNLRLTKPDISNFKKCSEYISDILENQSIQRSIINSKSKRDVDFTQGTNIIVGGNSLGRGVTFPNLQTTYYCRKAKSPQADTAWQHCRAFGYDRDPDLVRMFLPPTLFKLFVELNDSSNAIIECIGGDDLSSLSLQYPKGIKPTRASVIDQSKLRIIAGGVNYFPSFSKNSTSKDLDMLLSNYDDKLTDHKVDIKLILEILKHCGSDKPKTDWRAQPFIDCIKSLDSKYQEAILIVRRNRNIQRGSGTLLSPNDRQWGDKFKDKVTLTMYRVDGEKDWGGKLVWIPNIKLPKKNFYNMVD